MDGAADDVRTMRDRMLAGEMFRFDDSLNHDATRCRRLLRLINDATPDQDAERDAWLRELLGSFGEGSNIRPPFRCELGFQTHVGSRVFANFGLVCLDTAPVTIGDDSQLGPGVQLLTPHHPLEPGPRRERWETAEPITIGRNVWLGGGVIVCPGVTIGDDTVVGAGAVVTRDLPPGVLAVGNPAHVVRSVAGQPGDDSA
jgi:maltose O-acetyltransferase